MANYRWLFKLGIALFADKGTLEEDMDAIQKKAADAAKKSEEWGNTMGKAFKSVSKPLDALIPGFSNMAEALGKAIGGSKAFSASLGIMKTAIIGTGIGAIVIALGSLVAFLTSTTKGVDMLNKALSGIKAVVQTVIGRLAALGEAVVLLLKGQFKEAAEKAKEALKGVGDEIRENYKASKSIADREAQFHKDKIQMQKTEIDAEYEIERLRRIAVDEQQDINDRRRAATEMEKIQTNLSAQKVALANEEYSIALEKQKVGAESYADKEEEAKLYVAMISTQKEEERKLKSIEAVQQSITNTVNREAEARRKALEALKKANKPITIPIEFKLPGNIKALDTKSLIPMTPIVIPAPNFTLAEQAWYDYKDGVTTIWQTMGEQFRLSMLDMGRTAVDVGGMLASGLTSAIVGVGDAMGQMLTGSMEGWSALVGMILQTVSQIVNALLMESIAAMIAKEAHKGLAGLALAAVGVAGLLALWKSSMNKGKSTKMAEGGIAYGPTQALIGEYPGARSNPEVVAPLNKLQDYMAKTETQHIMVDGKISGRDLALVMRRMDKIN
jgi:hypothetical protein